MFNTYTEIYDQRGARYHEAMTNWPCARDNEFREIVSCANFDKKPAVVLDVPSGGGYLFNYVPDGVRLVSVDSANKFLTSGKHQGSSDVICAPHASIPLPDGSVDYIISLAGLHHIDNQAEVFREWYRLLRRGGVLAVGDALLGSKTVEFLDGVVGQFNSMGHSGCYIDSAQAVLLESIGFEVEVAEERAYTWNFVNKPNMLAYCRTLFCMDREPSDDELLSAIDSTVGFSESPSGCHMNWALYFLRAVKV